VKPLVSVITPTWQRHERLLNRCVPSVQAQAYPRVEHVIACDGQDPELAQRIDKLAQRVGAFCHPVTFVHLPEHAPEQHWGHLARLAGIEAAKGEYIAYVDDDDALRSDHVAKLAACLDADPEAGWAYSVMESHNSSGATQIGFTPPSCGQIGTPMIMHRRETLQHGTWGPASSVEDWELVQRWMNAGVKHVHYTGVTVDVWPSAFHEHS
jgi:glycosyltransferase involved in cell wall biosynthesis